MSIVIAFVLDLIFGDPYWLPHPICLIGSSIKKLENIIRALIKSEFWGGTLLWLIVVSASFLIPWSILYGLNTYVDVRAATIVEIFFCYQILATKSLKDESTKVYHALQNGDINEARKFLSYIVGRDTEHLDEPAITRATVETIAENTTDGVVAPLLYIMLGGAALGFAYKAINTMDSMLGYKNERYLYFGRFAARADDVANFIPALFTAICMLIATFLLGLNLRNAWRIFVRDRYNHKSPNSAQTESVCAGALEIQLGGNSCYFGKMVEKPTIGDPLRSICKEDIVVANDLMYITAVVALLCGTIVVGGKCCIIL